MANNTKLTMICLNIMAANARNPCDGRKSVLPHIERRKCANCCTQTRTRSLMVYGRIKVMACYRAKWPISKAIDGSIGRPKRPVNSWVSSEVHGLFHNDQGA